MLVLVLMNIATIVPLWPGNIGLVQAAVALPLRDYGVPYAIGFAYGLVLQAIEIRVGVGARPDRDRPRGHLVRDAPPHGEDDEESSEDAVEEVREMVEELDASDEAARESAAVSR